MINITNTTKLRISRFFVALVTLTAVFVASPVFAAPKGERVGTWNPHPFADEEIIEFFVTQESPFARQLEKRQTAGSYIYYFSRDGAILRIAQPQAVIGPRGVRVDNQGGFVFADALGAAIKRMDATGTIKTITSSVRQPKDIAFDTHGNFVIADFCSPSAPMAQI